MKPIPLQDLINERAPVVNTHTEHLKTLDSINKLALRSTKLIGSIQFFLMLAIVYIFWVILNLILPKELQFDKYPEFSILLLFSNLLQLLLIPLILVGQNLQNSHAEKKAEIEYETNVRAEREIVTILQHLEELHKEIKELKK